MFLWIIYATSFPFIIADITNTVTSYQGKFSCLFAKIGGLGETNKFLIVGCGESF